MSVGVPSGRTIWNTRTGLCCRGQTRRDCEASTARDTRVVGRAAPYRNGGLVTRDPRLLDHERVEIAGSRLAGPLLTYLGGKNWRLEAAYPYRDAASVITVPDQFVFDLSSVPRALWWLIAPVELSVVAPLLHDFLYRYGGNPPEGRCSPLEPIDGRR